MSKLLEGFLEEFLIIIDRILKSKEFVFSGLIVPKSRKRQI